MYQRTMIIEVDVECEDETFQEGSLFVSRVAVDCKPVPVLADQHGNEWEVIATSECAIAVTLTDY